MFFPLHCATGQTEKRSHGVPVLRYVGSSNCRCSQLRCNHHSRNTGCGEKPRTTWPPPTQQPAGEPGPSVIKPCSPSPRPLFRLRGRTRTQQPPDRLQPVRRVAQRRAAAVRRQHRHEVVVQELGHGAPLLVHAVPAVRRRTGVLRPDAVQRTVH